MDERIRERAYQIWLSEGQPLGHDADHWLRAKRQVEKELADAAASHRAGINDVPAANITVHKGPSSTSPTPGFEPPDGLATPGIKPRR